MDVLSLNDDNKPGRVIGRRHREEGVANKSKNLEIRARTVQLFESVSFE